MSDQTPIAATVIPRAAHNISRANISESALKVLYRLKGAGFKAYLVGGGVRDLLLGREPKDFDVATDAHPEDVRQVFRNCRLIGRRFRLAHVQYGREIIEVATFRGSGADLDDANLQLENGMIVRDNTYGTIEQDALRRDFTVNALYYSIADFSVLDFAGGVEDLEAGRLRLIGEPEQRYREDPVRMLRAVRFAGKLGLRLEPASEAPLASMAHLLHGVPAARLFEEVLKLFHTGTALNNFELLRHYGLFSHLFPETDHCLARQEHEFPLTFVARGLENTDQRIQENKRVSPAFLFAVLLWEPVRLRTRQLELTGQPPLAAVQQACTEVLAHQQSHVSVPKRFSLVMRDIWTLQQRLEARRSKRPTRLMDHPSFRAAYDFLLLRAAAGEADPASADWWTRYQQADPEQQGNMIRTETEPRPRRRRRPSAAVVDGVD